MRPRNVLAFSLSLILAAPVLAARGKSPAAFDGATPDFHHGLLAQRSGEAQAGKAPKAGPGQPVFMPASGLKWTDLDPKGAPGVKVANLWGDHAKGAFGAYFKLPA